MSDIQEAVKSKKPAKPKAAPPKKGAAVVAQGLLARTPDQILGPFYPLSLKPTTSGDLTKKGKAEGQVLYVTGRVLSTAGKPVAGAKIEIWQANSKGRYRHPNDDSDQPLDPNFSGYAVLTSGKDGSYRLKTIKPASYQTSPGNFRPAHLHFCITSKREQLTTQMYFDGRQLQRQRSVPAKRAPQGRADRQAAGPDRRHGSRVEAGGIRYRADEGLNRPSLQMKCMPPFSWIVWPVM